MEYLYEVCRKFLSTLPARGATELLELLESCKAISIHAPREGSDADGHGPQPVQQISIHAPREGSDERWVSKSPNR